MGIVRIFFGAKINKMNCNKFIFVCICSIFLCACSESTQDLSGTYYFENEKFRETLILNSDNTFLQQVVIIGKNEIIDSVGTWKLIGAYRKIEMHGLWIGFDRMGDLDENYKSRLSYNNNHIFYLTNFLGTIYFEGAQSQEGCFLKKLK